MLIGNIMMRLQFLKIVYFQLHNMKKGEEMCVFIIYVYKLCTHICIDLYIHEIYIHIFT